jgi:membrane fusion protein, multidrug efflux system
MIHTLPNQLNATSRRAVFSFSNAIVCRLFVMLLTVGCVLGGCSSERSDKEQKDKAGRSKAVMVTTALCRQHDVPVVILATGRVEASATVGIRSRINGTLAAIHCKEGQEVQEGALLFTIDRRPYIALVKAKEALLAKDRAELLNAEKERDRYLPAARSGYVSAEQADQATTKVASIAATVQADEAALDSARLDLEFCSLSAPFAGRTGVIEGDVGSLIKANADTPLVTINRIDPITVAFDIPGRNLADVRKYMAENPLEVEALSGMEGETVKGTLAFIDNIVDPTTGTLLVKADFANTGRVLWPGQMVPVSLRLTTRRDALVVPSQAVQISQDGASVYVVRQDGTVEFRPVTAGAASGPDTVIEQGLKTGERVVTDGHLQLIDGSKVEDRAGQPGQPAKDAAKGGKRGTP